MFVTSRAETPMAISSSLAATGWQTGGSENVAGNVQTELFVAVNKFPLALVQLFPSCDWVCQQTCVPSAIRKYLPLPLLPISNNAPVGTPPDCDTVPSTFSEQ